MILRSRTVDIEELRRIAAPFNLAVEGESQPLSRGEFKGGYRTSCRLMLIEPTPRHKEETAHYQRRSHEDRRVRAVCWHGYRDVMLQLFAHDPSARLQTAQADYRGANGFERDYPATGDKNIGSMMEPMHYRDACDCERY